MLDKTQILNELKRHGGFVSDADFARFLGINEQNLYVWKKRGTFRIDIIVDKFPEIERCWLLTGEGEMLKSDTVIQHGRGSVQVQGHGNVDTVVGEMHGGTINHNGGKDMMIDEQKKEVDKMFEAIIIAVNGFQKASERHDDYVVRQDDYIKRQDEYIARIINHSYLRNKENMERLDVQLTQQNKLIEMVLDQNRRTQDRADRLVDMLEKKL